VRRLHQLIEARTQREKRRRGHDRFEQCPTERMIVYVDVEGYSESLSDSGARVNNSNASEAQVECGCARRAELRRDRERVDKTPDRSECAIARSARAQYRVDIAAVIDRGETECAIVLTAGTDRFDAGARKYEPGAAVGAEKLGR
jgi:hypothetical protein